MSLLLLLLYSSLLHQSLQQLSSFRICAHKNYTETETNKPSQVNTQANRKLED